MAREVQKKSISPAFNIIFIAIAVLSLLILEKDLYTINQIKETVFFMGTVLCFGIVFFRKRSIGLYLPDMIMLFFLGLNIILFLLLPYRLFAFTYVQVMFVSAAFYFAAREFSPEVLLDAIELSGFAASFYGIALYYGADIFDLYGGLPSPRTPSFFANSTFFAGFLVPVIAVSAGRFFTADGIFRKSLHALVFSADLFAMFLTKTRAAFLGLFVFFVLFAVFLIKEKLLGKRVLIGGAAVLALILLLVPHDYWTRIKMLKDIRTGTPMFRLYTWHSTMQIIKDHPFGVGPGNFRVFYPSYKSKRIFLFEGHSNAETIHAHNDYLETAADSGFLGLGMYLVMLFMFLALFLRSGIRGGRKVMIAALGAGLAGFLAGNFFCVNLKWISSIILLQLVLALGMSIIKERFKARITVKITALSALIVIMLLSFFFFLSSRRTSADRDLAKAIGFSKYGVLKKSKKDETSAMKAFQQARALYERSLKKYTSVIALYFSGNLRLDLFSLQKDPALLDEAMEFYNKAGSHAPDYVQLHLLRGRVHFTKGEKKEALTEFETYFRQNPVDPDVYNYLVSLYDELGMPEKKSAFFDVLERDIKDDLNIKPGYSELYPVFEYLFSTRGRPKDSLELYLELAGKVGKKETLEKIYARIAVYFNYFGMIKEGREYFNGLSADIKEIKEVKALLSKEAK